jgi:hypothetical protein
MDQLLMRIMNSVDFFFSLDFFVRYETSGLCFGGPEGWSLKFFGVNCPIDNQDSGPVKNFERGVGSVELVVGV